jgi:hypothetical protein
MLRVFNDTLPGLYYRPVFYIFPDGPTVEMRGGEVGAGLFCPHKLAGIRRKEEKPLSDPSLYRRANNGERSVPNK